MEQQTVLNEWGTAGTGAAQFRFPRSITIDDDGTTSPGWLLKLDRKTGNLLDHAEVTDGHEIAALGAGEILSPRGAGVWWPKPIP